MNNNQINVTKSFIPPIDEYIQYVERAFVNEWLTNRGSLVLDLENVLKKYLGVHNILLLTNGTLPIQISLKVLAKGGEVITTPFSYVATTSSILWENCKPVFVDIDANYFTIDETKIEKAITPETTAILATHVFGNPCNLEAIDLIAKKYNLKVIYDAAHAFGVKYKGQSVFNYGNVSTCSFHATKIFHTAEGGALFCNEEKLFHQLFYSHNFGHNGPLDFHGIGINAKISELQAAMGLAVYPYIGDILSSRKKIVDTYTSLLKNSNLQLIQIRPETEWNFSYYPVVFESEEQLIEVQLKLNKHDVFPRRYFYPSLNKLPYLPECSMPVSESISSRILCLPLYVGLSDADIKKIVSIILN